jgi:hypothetical protein
MQWRGWERGLRRLLGWGILVTLMITFLPIVTLLQQLIALDQYAEQGQDWAKAVLNIPFIGGAPACSAVLAALRLFSVYPVRCACAAVSDISTPARVQRACTCLHSARLVLKLAPLSRYDIYRRRSQAARLCRAPTAVRAHDVYLSMALPKRQTTCARVLVDRGTAALLARGSQSALGESFSRLVELHL